MSSTAALPAVGRPPGCPPACLPLANLSQLVADTAVSRRVNIRSIAGNDVRREFVVEMATIGDVPLLVSGLGLPVDQIVVDETRDGVRTTFETSTFHGWKLTIQHGQPTPTIEPQEGNE